MMALLANNAALFVLSTSTAWACMHPHIKVIGLPLSTITVRLKDAGELCSAPADAEGVLAFRVNEPLLPGPTVLQTRQKVDGPSSDWRERSFTVKEPPKVPRIEAPQPGRPTGRVPTIRGAAETRGQIQLRHEGDAEDEHFGTTRGVMQWSWKAQEAWDLGTYTIQARHEDEGDCSEWTDPVTFEVVDSLYAIGDALPVLAEPVVGKDQRARLRVQVVSGTTGQPAANANVEWRRKGQQEILATTKTDDSGWTEFLYIPDIAGLNEVLAYIANNDAVEMTELFSVNALTDNGWDSQAVFYLDGELVDLAKGDIVLLKGKVYSLELRVKSGSPLVGAMVILQDLWEAQEAGLQFAPAIGVPQLVEEGKPVVWSISFAEGDGVHFGLKLTSPVLPDWRLPGRISDPVEEVEVNFDSFPKLFGGDPVYPCFGASHTFLVKPTTQSLLLGEEVMLALTEEAASLGVVLTPNTAQKMVEGGVTWTLDCINSVNAGNFAAQLKVPAWNFSSRELAMSLGHNKVSRAETFGPQEMGGAGSYWMYGIRVTSTFTGQNAGGVPVIVRVAGMDPVHGVTERSGWIYVNYYDGQTASFQIYNRYDGSTAG